MPIDVEKARADTPAADNLIHFNNAGSALPPTVVLDAQLAYLQREAAIGGYEAELEAEAAIMHTYDAVAQLIGGQPDEIAIVDSATRAWDTVFYSIPFRPGDRILTAMSEYASNYIAFLQMAQRSGVQVEVIPNDDSGQTSPIALQNMIDARVRLIAINHVPTNSGLVNPAAEIGKVARAAGVLYLLDACQSVGQLPIDVRQIGCDFLSATGRKYLRGPRGTGFLYVRRNLIADMEPYTLDMHAATWVDAGRYEIRPDARRFEQWESNLAAKIALGVAVDYALGWGMADIWQRVHTLGETLRSRLRDIPGVVVQDKGAVRGGIVTFTMQGFSPTQIRAAMWQQRINVWAVTINSARLDMDAKGLGEVVRASLHYYNTNEEIARFCAVLAEMVVANGL